jgi:hypothetical protein
MSKLPKLVNKKTNAGLRGMGGGGNLIWPYSDLVLATQPTHLLAYQPLWDLSGTASTDIKNGRNGAYRNGALLGQSGIGDGKTSVWFDGSNDFINLSNAALAAAFNGTEGSLLIWVKLDASILQDGVAHQILYLVSTTSSNFINIKKATTNNDISIIYQSGGVLRSRDYLAATDQWTCIALTWTHANNQMRAHINGVNSGGDFNGGLSSWPVEALDTNKMFIGATTTVPTSVSKGNFAHFAVWDIALTTEEIYALSGRNRRYPPHPVFTRISAKSLWSSTAPADWLGRPMLCDNDGTWIALYRQSIDHGTSDAGVQFHLRFSADEGATWSNVDTLVGGAALTGAPFVNHATNTNQTDGIIMRAPNGDLLVQIYEKPGAAGTYQYRSIDDGATWVDEGRIVAATPTVIIGGQDHAIVGADMYITVMYDPNGDGSHPHTSALYKSSDNGATWTKQGDIDTGIDTSENAIISTGGNNMLVVQKDISFAKTYQYTSTDLGATWSARSEIQSQVSILNRPRLKYDGSRLLLTGRDYISATSFFTVVYASTDNGATWGSKFYPDLPGDYQDGGYCDWLKRTDGKYYMLSYAGLTTVADIKEYIFS